LEPLKSVKPEVLNQSERETHYNPRITILGIGNLLLQDEGVGVHLIHRLADIKMPGSVDLVDGGTSPDISSLVDNNIDKLIIVDAVEAGGKPGTIYRFSASDLDVDQHNIISLHEIGILNSLQTMNVLNEQPKSIVIFGIEPESMDFGLDLSSEVNEQMSQIIELVLEEIKGTYISTEANR
jgi:hydrogenase maturation protease